MAKTIYRDEYRILLELLREARAHSELTQRAVAEKLGWDQSALSLVERGGRRMDVIEFIDYFRAIGADPVAGFQGLLRRIGSWEKSAAKRRTKR